MLRLFRNFCTRCGILLLGCGSGIFLAEGAEVAPDIQVIENEADFSINSSTLPVTPAMRAFVDQIKPMVEAGHVVKVKVIGSSSPDGPTAFNDRLALQRARAVADFFIESTGIRSSLVSVGSDGENIAGFLRLIQESKSPYRNRILAICQGTGSQEDHEAALRVLDNGKAWAWLAADIFPQLRTASISVEADDGRVMSLQVCPEVKEQNPPVVIEEPEVVAPYIEEVTAVYEEAEIIPEAEDEWVRHLYLKTNMPAWFMLWTNVAVEVDLAPHWSATLPVYYSGFNYFKHTLKFRTLTLQPEARYWFRGDNSGPFIGAHFSVAWWNTAFDGQYRYQDHYRHTPAIGGGLAVGWRFNFCRNPRWQMEATIGGGVYKLDYDLFQNKYNGLLVGRRKRTFYGIDQAALTISYRFDIEHKKSVKKGGDQ